MVVGVDDEGREDQLQLVVSQHKWLSWWCMSFSSDEEPKSARIVIDDDHEQTRQDSYLPECLEEVEVQSVVGVYVVPNPAK